MMQLPFFFLTLWFHFYVLNGGQGMVTITKTKGTTIECSSNTDLTFKFKKAVNNEYYAIAECDLMIQSCYIERGLENTFNISYTGRGGILQILSLREDTYGTYECSETYTPHNFVTVDVVSYDTTLDVNNDIPDVSVGASISIYLLVCFLCVILGCVITNAWFKATVCKRVATDYLPFLKMENDTPAQKVGTLQASGQRRSDCTTQPLVEETELKNKQPVVDECKSMDADNCMPTFRESTQPFVEVTEEKDNPKTHSIHLAKLVNSDETST